MTKEKKKAGQAVVEALVAEGVDVVFGLAGSHIHAISDALIDAPGIRFVVCKHENNAALMADMYGRLTGRPGVCLVTAGPGATNSLTGVAQAFAVGSPVVHISGTVPRGAKKGSFHGVDRPDFLKRAFSNVAKWSVEIDEAEDIPGVLAEAFSLAGKGRPGPVHIDLPEDLLAEPPTEMWTYERMTSGADLDYELVKRVTESLLAASKPLICAGVALRGKEASNDLVELAERLGAPVTFSRNAPDVFPSDNHLCAGAFNPYPNDPFPLQLLEQSDLLLAIGMRGDTASAEMLMAKAPAESIFLVPEGEAPAVEGASLAAAVDCKALLSLLKESIPSREGEDLGWASQRMAEVKGLYRRGLKRQVESHRGRTPMHFGLALRQLIPLLEHNALVVGDIGTHGVWASWFFELYGTQTYLEPGSWGAMGFALPAAIAGKLVHPERQVVGITGDGAFLMSCSDFGTALELGTKIVLVVLNDRQYGMIYRLQTDDFGRTIGTELRPPDLVKFAESYGAVGIRVEDDGQLEQAYRQALDADAPVVVDVVCGYGFPHPSPTDWLRGDRV